MNELEPKFPIDLDDASHAFVNAGDVDHEDWQPESDPVVHDGDPRLEAF